MGVCASKKEDKPSKQGYEAVENPPASGPTKSIMIKSKAQEIVLVPESEITLTLGMSSSINYITGDFVRQSFDISKVDSQFLRDRCYTLHRDTFIAVEGGRQIDQQKKNYDSLFARAEKLGYKKIMIKSPNLDLQGAVTKLSQSHKLKINQDEVRLIQVNFCFRLFKNLASNNIKEVMAGISELKKGFGKLNHIVLDCRPLDPCEVFLVMEEVCKLKEVLAHELEFVINWRKDDKPDYLQQLYHISTKLADTIAFDISIVSSTENGETLLIFSKALESLTQEVQQEENQYFGISSLGFRFLNTVTLEDERCVAFGKALQGLLSAILDSKCKEVMRAFSLDISELSLSEEGYIEIILALQEFGKQERMNAERIKYCSFLNLKFKNCPILKNSQEQIFKWLSDIINLSTLNPDQFTFNHLSLDFSGHEFNVMDTFIRFMLDLVAGVKNSKNALQFLNLNFHKTGLRENEFSSLFKCLSQALDLLSECAYNNKLLSHFNLNISGNYLLGNGLSGFNNFLLNLFNVSKMQFKTCFETVSLDVSACKFGQVGFDQIFKTIDTGFMSLKPEDLNTKPLTLSTFILHLNTNYIENDQALDLQYFKPFCEHLRQLFQSLSQINKLLNCFMLDFGGNQFGPNTILQLGQAFEPLKACCQYNDFFCEEFSIWLSQSYLRNEQFNSIFEGLKDMATQGKISQSKKTFRKLSIDFSNNYKTENLDSFSSLIGELFAAYMVNLNSMQEFNINFANTSVQGTRLEKLKSQLSQFVERIGLQPFTDVTTLESLTLNFMDSSLTEDCLLDILEALMNLVPLIDNEKYNATTFNQLCLNFQGSKVDDKAANALGQLMESLIFVSNNNSNTLFGLKLNLNNVCKNGQILNKFIQEIPKFNLSGQNQVSIEQFELELKENNLQNENQIDDDILKLTGRNNIYM